MISIGGNLTFTLELEDTELVNQPATYWTNLAILAVTLAVNIPAAVVLWREEDSPINRIIIWDCVLNIVKMLITVIPHHQLNNAYLCSIWLFSNMTLNIWNRLVSVAIVVFRYILVCIAVHYCHYCALK